MPFGDRREAGRSLGAALRGSVGREAVVLGLPRGGVPVAFEVARALGATLDVLVVRKLGAPGHPELGLGAVAPSGVRVVDRRLVAALGVSHADLAAVEQLEVEEMARRAQRYRGDAPPPEVRGRTVVLVDDGLATGGTMRAAVAWARAQGAAFVVVAVPVGPPEGVHELAAVADRVVCLEQPEDFGAVGLWYGRFEQTSDEEVVRLLREAGSPGAPPRAGPSPRGRGRARV